MNRESARALALSIPATMAAYFAGIIDGEGTITTHWGIGWRSARSRYLVIRVSVAMCEPAAMQLMCNYFGTKLRKQEKRDHPNWRPVYFFECNNWRAYAIIFCIRPYLVVKRRQAELAMQFQVTKKRFRGYPGSGVVVPPNVMRERKATHRRMKAMNKRGL